MGTGIRVSECVGLDIQDVDFNHNGVKVVRKGGNEAVVYFGDDYYYLTFQNLDFTEYFSKLFGHYQNSN